MDMRVKIAGVEWNNPVTVASGTFGSGEEILLKVFGETAFSKNPVQRPSLYLNSGGPE